MKTILIAILFAPWTLAADTQPAGGVKTACGPEAIKFSVKPVEGQQAPPQPEPGKALVYVVEDYERASNELGTPTVRVGLNGTWVGANRGNSYLFLSLEPGEQHLCVDWQSSPPWFGPKVSLNSFTADAGQTYYFRARVMEHSRLVWTLDLDLINPDEGRRLVAISPLSDYRQKK